MKSLLHIEYDGDSTIVSGDVRTRDELEHLSVALANLLYTEEELSDSVLKALNILFGNEERQEEDVITIDIESLINNKHKS
jgi:hypothetical protein